MSIINCSRKSEELLRHPFHLVDVDYEELLRHLFHLVDVDYDMKFLGLVALFPRLLRLHVQFSAFSCYLKAHICQLLLVCDRQLHLCI